jgi:hypothetical protein
MVGFGEVYVTATESAEVVPPCDVQEATVLNGAGVVVSGVVPTNAVLV